MPEVKITQTTAKDTQHQNGLFALPPEIRNHIFELAMHVSTADGKVQIVKLSKSIFHPHARTRGPSVLTLLLTCRQIYTEAKGLFYSTNHLRFTEHPANSNCLVQFLYKLSSERLEAVEALTIVLPAPIDAVGLLWKIRRRCPRLRVLHVMPGYVSSSEKHDRMVGDLITSIPLLEEIKVVRAPWILACKARASWLQSIALGWKEGRDIDSNEKPDMFSLLDSPTFRNCLGAALREESQMMEAGDFNFLQEYYQAILARSPNWED